MPRLPGPRGPITEYLFSCLTGAGSSVAEVPLPVDDPLTGDDFHLALYVCYELFYEGFDEVDDSWEWEPSLIALRTRLEGAFEEALRDAVRAPSFDPSRPMFEQLRAIEESGDEGPSLSRFMQSEATLTHFREFVTHRSAYQLKEADPHTWAIPRIRGAAKAAMVEIQYDEYGSGRGDRIHAEMFRRTMTALALDGSYGAYLSRIPGVTLATVNLMSMFGLNRRWRGACVGHLALFEMTSPIPNGRYAKGLVRLGVNGDALGFFIEHVEADAVHEVIAAHDLAGSFAIEEPRLADDVLFGAAALVTLEGAFAEHLLSRWSAGRSSLLAPDRIAVT